MVVDTEVCYCLPAAMGNGGGYVPMVVDTLVFDKAQITSKFNYSQPTWGGTMPPTHKRGGASNSDYKDSRE